MRPWFSCFNYIISLHHHSSPKGYALPWGGGGTEMAAHSQHSHTSWASKAPVPDSDHSTYPTTPHRRKHCLKPQEAAHNQGKYSHKQSHLGRLLFHHLLFSSRHPITCLFLSPGLAPANTVVPYVLPPVCLAALSSWPISVLLGSHSQLLHTSYHQTTFNNTLSPQLKILRQLPLPPGLKSKVLLTGTRMLATFISYYRPCSTRDVSLPSPPLLLLPHQHPSIFPASCSKLLLFSQASAYANLIFKTNTSSNAISSRTFLTGLRTRMSLISTAGLECLDLATYKRMQNAEYLWKQKKAHFKKKPSSWFLFPLSPHIQKHTQVLPTTLILASLNCHFLKQRSLA